MNERALQSKPAIEWEPKRRTRIAAETASAVPLFLSGNYPIRRKASCACGGGCPNCETKNSNMSVSQPTDAAEIEADRIADKVMRMSASQTIDSFENKSPFAVQRKCDDCGLTFIDDADLQRKEISDDSSSRSAQTPLLTSTTQDGGNPLPDHLREFFEPRFGYDFSSVRIHTGAKAAESAKKINALAYTIGQSVVFGEGQYSPKTTAGKKLLAHELAHTIQQANTSDRTSRKIQRSAVNVTDAAGEANQSPITGEFPPSGGLVDGREGATGKTPQTIEASREGEETHGNGSSSGTQTLCFAISELTPSPVARLFGSAAELIVNRDYCSVMGCSPFLTPRSSGTDYFDNTLGAVGYIAFLGHHNSLSLLQIAALAIQSQISMNRPDILAHKTDRKDYYEIKPNSISGRAAGRAKLRNLLGFFSLFSLPYVAGTAYTPTAEILLARGTVGALPLEIFLRLQRIRDGLIVYDICARGDLLGIGLRGIIAILIALIIIILGGKVEFPLPIPAPALGLSAPDNPAQPNPETVAETPLAGNEAAVG